MIILDTNVLSALMRDEPDPAVVTWPRHAAHRVGLDDRDHHLRGTDRVGAARPSRRRQRLESAFEQLVAGDLDDRVLAFDTAAADASGNPVAKRQRAGRSIEIRDAQIAGISFARKATLATRNVRHFKDLGVRLADPWAPTGRRTR